MRMAITCLMFAGALALPAAAVAGEAPAQASAQAQQKLTFTEKLELFLFGATAEHGQPGVECGEDGALTRPGHSADAPGSAFHEGGTAGQHYAGEQPQNSKNPKSVSQYDTACAHAQSPF